MTPDEALDDADNLTDLAKHLGGGADLCLHGRRLTRPSELMRHLAAAAIETAAATSVRPLGARC